jgi:glutamate synthase (NADPH/NADH) small chain
VSSIKDEAERCLKCKVPHCSKACPVGTPVPQAMQLFLDGGLRDAGALLFANNPMSAVCSVVCPHEKNCYGHCVLNKKGTPVQSYRVEEYTSQFYLETFAPEPAPRNGKRVAVVGAGPAGITASLLLAGRGYGITLFDVMDGIGGALRYGIPEFRLHHAKLADYRRLLDALGVKFRPNTRIGSYLTGEDLFNDGYDAVFVAGGAPRPQRLGLLGETLGHVAFAVDYLRSPEAYSLGKRVAVVGAGNVAVDAARTALREGAAQVTILNFMGPEEVAAYQDEVELALIDGVEFLHYTKTVRITEAGVTWVRVQRVEAEDGGITFEDDWSESGEVQADAVIIAVGQGPASDVPQIGLRFTQAGLIETDGNGRTSRPRVFAAGDIVTGPRTVVEAVAHAKLAVEALDERCRGASASAVHDLTSPGSGEHRTAEGRPDGRVRPDGAAPDDPGRGAEGA